MSSSSEASKQRKASTEQKPTSRSTPLSMVDENEDERRAAIIGTVRAAFITAPVGEMPTIRKLMRQQGLVDDSGRPTGTVTELNIRKVMEAENWKQRRVDWLHETCDLIPEEIQLRSLLWSIEIEKILFQTLQLQHHASVRYFQSGQATSLDNTALIDPPGVKGSVLLAEALHRHSLSVHVQLQNGLFDQGPTDKVSRKQIECMNSLRKLSDEELRQEIERLETILKAQSEAG